MINQLKGALKMLFVLILALGALEIWILKDNRHFSIVIVPAHYEIQAINPYEVGQ